MDNHLKKLADRHRKMSLSEREKAGMRLRLAAFIEEHPARVPFLVRVQDRFFAIPGILGSRHAFAGYRLVGAALVLVMVTGVGTTYAAAQQALPGDALYGLKVSVAEPVEHALAASNQSQAQWDVTLANRRLTEAEKLASAHKLTPTTAAIVQTQLDDVTANLNASIAAAASSDESASSSAAVASTTSEAIAIAQASDAQSDLEASLAAHAQVLDALASSSPSVAKSAAPLIAAIQAHAARARTARFAALDALDGNATATLSVVVADERQAVESQIIDIHELAPVPDESTTSTSTATSSLAESADTAASSTLQNMNDASTSQKKGDYKNAFRSFQKALQDARAAQVAEQAQSDFGVDLPLQPGLASTSPESIVASTTPTSTMLFDASSTAATSTKGHLLKMKLYFKQHIEE